MSETEDPETESESVEYDPEYSEDYWPGEWVPRSDIKPNDWNPNRLDDDEFEQLVASIKDNGWTMPIVVHAEEKYIIDGEHRWLAADHLPDDPDLTPEGVPADHVPVYGITVEEEQAKLATVQHNRARGEVHVAPLKEYLSGLNERGVLDSVVDRIGYSQEEAAELLDDLSAPDTTDETMPWEEESEAEILDGEEDEEESEEVDEREAPIPDLHQDRTLALRDDPDESTLENIESVSEVLTDAEFDRVCRALGDEMRAQSLVNLCRYVEATDALSEVKE